MKSPEPESRLSVYKRLSDVPQGRRLETFAGVYDGRDVWSEYLEWYEREYDTTYFNKANRGASRWKDHMNGRNRHYALARPNDVEAWAESLLNDLALRTATEYWWWIHRLYRWLMGHTDHPHTYNPFLMAAAESPASRQIWNCKMEKCR